MKPVKFGEILYLEAEAGERFMVRKNSEENVGRWLRSLKYIPENDERRILSGELSLLGCYVLAAEGEGIEPGTYYAEDGVELITGKNFQTGRAVFRDDGQFQVFQGVPKLPFVQLVRSVATPTR